jgi:hypothetical protein
MHAICNTNIPFHSQLGCFPNGATARQPHIKGRGQIYSVTRSHTAPIDLPQPFPTHPPSSKGKQKTRQKEKNAMSYRDEGESPPVITSFPCFVASWRRRVVRIGLYARSRLMPFLFFLLSLRKAVVTSSWPAALEASCAHFHAVLATHRSTATPTRVMSGPSLSRSTSQKPTRGATSPRPSPSSSPNHHEPGHDLAAHGDLERHCGAPWFS